MEKPQHHGRARIVADRDPQHRLVAKPALDPFDPAFDLGRDPGLQQPDRRDLGAVFVLPRQLQPEILQRGQAARGEFLGHARPDPGHAGHRLRVEIDGGPVLTAWHCIRIRDW
ncbi:hypothetical protein D3C71_1927670 [compost metagenome]